MLSTLLAAAIIDQPSRHVLVVCNGDSQGSVSLAEYYAQRRGLAKDQIVKLDVSQSENIDKDEYGLYVEKPVRRAIERAADRIDYIVTCKGVPIKVGVDDPADMTQGISLDAMLSQMDRDVPTITSRDDKAQIAEAVSPYFGSETHFSSARYSMFLVTRLDGEVMEDCIGLIEHSLGAKRSPGPFYFDFDPAKDAPGYQEIQDGMRTAETGLKSSRFIVGEETTAAFLPPTGAVMGYISWGSNDNGYDRRSLRRVQFMPGALADIYVNTSAHTMKPWQSGAAQITDLIRDGVTGIKGYVSEPWTIGLTHSDILFDRYTKGFNLAESFYAATPLCKWKDVIIGDPLCNPYSATQ